MENKYKKIVLAYSGGLDTSCLIPWLKEHYNAEIIAVSVDVGQGSELDGLEEKAIKTGASKIYIEDVKEEFVKDYIFPAIKLNATYENYMLGTALARPLIAKRLVEIAKKEGADAICHGCTGKGNDQVRFELAIKAFAPDMEVIAPWRFWELNSREKEIEYAEKHNIPLKISKETNYSKDKNLWHLSHEGLDLEDPKNEAPLTKKDFLEMSISYKEAKDEETYVKIHFEKGIPTKVDDKELSPVELIEKLNKIGGENACGILDIIENRLIGMKVRGVYETPAGSILYKAHEKLEELTVDRESRHFKNHLSLKFGELVYNGQWFTPLRKAICAFADSIEETVTGDITLKLYKGNIIPVSVESDYSLFSIDFATFGEDNTYNQSDSQGFINIYGLPIKVRALNDIKLNKKSNKNFPKVD